MNLLIDQQSRECRQHLGAQAWVALEHLALAAKPEEGGWTAPVGVRDVAIGLGVTKDTAARAVRALIHARLVDPITTVGASGRKRRGYRINLPEGVSIRDCPADRDAVTVAPSELIVPTVADAGSRHGTAAPGHGSAGHAVGPDSAAVGR